MAVTRKNISTLILGHWNANGLYGNINELRQFICDHRVDIMLINEVRLNSDKIVNVHGYRCIRKDKNSKGTGGGVMIFVKNNILFHEIPIETTSVEAVAIQLHDRTVIVSAYKPPQIKLDNRDLDKMFKTSNKVLIYGDINAKNTAWNCRNTNLNGKMLLEYSIRHLYEVIFPDTYT